MIAQQRTRANFDESVIDKEGYHAFTVPLIQATVTTPSGETIIDTVECPENAGVALVGDTAIGDCKMRLWGLKKPLAVNLERAPAPPAP